MDNPSAIGDNIFRFKLYGTGTGAIYNQYTMATKSNSSTTTNAFWGSPIKQNQVKSITYTSISNKPSTVDGEYDISATANSGNILMWWIQNEETPTLYDVYVANTHGGNVKANTTAQYMFAYLPNCVSIDLTYLDTSNTTTFNRMFENDAKLTQIIMHNLNTSNNTYMAYMFSDCTKLTSLDLSSFDTRKVTSMRAMFLNCSSLTSLDLSNFYTPKLSVVNNGSQYGMFEGCSSLETVNLTNYNTSKVTNMYAIFLNCKNLVNIDLSTFNTQSLNYFGTTSYNNGMFANCSKLEKVNLSSFSFSKITNVQGLFYGDSKLKEIDLSGADFSKLTNVTSTFTSAPANCKIYIDCSQRDTFISKFESRAGLTTVNNESCNA